MSGVKLSAIQHGLEVTPGTGVAATWKWPGEGELEFEDKVVRPPYMTGEAGQGAAQDVFVAQAGTKVTLNDTPCSGELLVYLLNIAVKGIATGTGIGPYTWDFPFPKNAATLNAIKTYTFEYVTAQQTYKALYGFCESFSIHADEGANDGVVMVNGVVRARKAATATATASLNPYANHSPFVVDGATVKMDALGVAAGTAAATSGYIKAFSLDCTTGWFPGRYLDGRTSYDFSVHEGGGNNYALTGTFKALLNANAVSDIANAQAGTGKVWQINLQGANSRFAKLNLPLIFTAVPKIGREETNGLITVSFPWAGAFDRAFAGGQAPNISLSLPNQITLT